MKLVENSGLDVFAIQTLYDGKWRYDEKFNDEEQAQRYAARLVPDWGKQRVRLLHEKYDAGDESRHYFELDLCPPKSRYKRVIERVQKSGLSITGKLRKQVAVSVMMMTIGVGAFVIVLSGLTSQPTLAGNDKNIQKNEAVAEATAPIARSILAIFAEVSKNNYGQPTSSKDVPIRLRGDWSRHCNSGMQDLQLMANTLTDFDGAIANDKELQIVFQSGQTYGLVTSEGRTRILELITIDQVKLIGHLTVDGHFHESNKKLLLNRCL